MAPTKIGSRVLNVEPEQKMPDASKLSTATRIVRRRAGSTVRQVTADICVLGGGIAGVSAALEAARLGRKVALVDGLPALGGQAVNSLIGTFCGLYSNGPDGYQLTHGIADEILRDLGAQGALHTRLGPNTKIVLYDEVRLARWIEEAVRRAGITVLLGAVQRGVKREDRRIKSIDLATRYGDVTLAATGFVDASGDAALAWEAGLACREPADGPIYGTQMFALEDIDETRQPTREEVVSRLREKAESYGLVRRDGFAFAFPGRGLALVNMTHVETPLEPIAASRNALEGKAQADKVVRFLADGVPGGIRQCPRAHLRLSRHPPNPVDRRPGAALDRRCAGRHAFPGCRRADRLAGGAAQSAGRHCLGGLRRGSHALRAVRQPHAGRGR